MASRPPMTPPSQPASPQGAGGVAPVTPPASAPTSNDLDGPGEEVTPEEQALYTAFVQAGLDVIVPPSDGKPQFAPFIFDLLRGQYDDQVVQLFAQADPPISPDPIDAAAVTGCLVVIMAEASAEQGGVDIPNDIVFMGGAEILEYIINVSDAAKIHDFSDQDIDNTVARAMDLYRTSASTRTDQEGLKGEFGEIVAADKAGTLNSLLPGMKGAEQRAAQAQQPAPPQQQGQPQ